MYGMNNILSAGAQTGLSTETLWSVLPMSDGVFFHPGAGNDYRIIEKRQQNFLLIILCSISGFTGIYYLLLFLSIRQKQDIFNLYYGIFSILFCVYSGLFFL